MPLLIHQLPLPTLSPRGGSPNVRLLKRPLALGTTVWGLSPTPLCPPITFEDADFPAGESPVSNLGSLGDPGILPLTA